MIRLIVHMRNRNENGEDFQILFEIGENAIVKIKKAVDAMRELGMSLAMHNISVMAESIGVAAIVDKTWTERELLQEDIATLYDELHLEIPEGMKVRTTDERPSFLRLDIDSTSTRMDGKAVITLVCFEDSESTTECESGEMTISLEPAGKAEGIAF
jgi:hypothetical protein